MPLNSIACRARCSRAIALLVLLVPLGCIEIGGERKESSPGEVDAKFDPSTVTTIDEVPVAAVRSALARRLQQDAPPPLTDEQWAHVRALYRTYGGFPLWLDHNGLRETRTETLMTALLDATDDALPLDGYPLASLAQVMETLPQNNRPSPEQLAEADVVLTSSYVAIGEDLLTGQADPRSVSPDWHIGTTESQVDSALARTLRDVAFDKTMKLMRPPDPGYEALRREMQRYRAIVARGGWPTVPAGKALKPGDPAPAARMAALRQRLAVEALLTESGPNENGSVRDSAAPGTAPPRTTPAGGSPVYDRVLAGAVAEYQRRHGIVVDSVLGSGTVASLNVPATYRLGQIAANLERHRWMPRTLGDRHIVVNVPAFQLQAFDGDRVALEMKVIVGSNYVDRATPAFADSMQYIVFRPYWNPTDDIMEKELWPKVNADPDYLARNNYEIVEESGKQRIRQKPGDDNSLGLVKFMFPNDFNIYLHDTPEDGLFEQDVRAFSHGCIRLEKPAELAQWVLGWPAERVRQAMEAGGDDQQVTLPRKIPVYIAYFTAFVRDGTLHFGNDLYARDDAMVRAVAAGALPSPVVEKAVVRLRELVED